MKMKDKWGFLNDHPFYTRTEEMSEVNEYIYHDKNEENEILASILLFQNIKNSASWSFEQWDDEKKITYRKLDATPSWFQELYQQAEKKRSEMTRLREIFEKKEKPVYNSAAPIGMFSSNPEHETDIDDIFAEFLAEDE